MLGSCFAIEYTANPSLVTPHRTKSFPAAKRVPVEPASRTSLPASFRAGASAPASLGGEASLNLFASGAPESSAAPRMVVPPHPKARNDRSNEDAVTGKRVRFMRNTSKRASVTCDSPVRVRLGAEGRRDLKSQTGSGLAIGE